MPLHTLFRSVSLLAVVLGWAYLPWASWASLVGAWAFGHYALSLLYARVQAIKLVGQPRYYFPLVVLAAGTAALYWGGFPVLIYFAVHHVFNETYMLSRALRLPPTTEARDYRCASQLVSLVLFLVLLRNNPILSFLPPEVGFAALIPAYIFFFYVLSQLRGVLQTRSQWVDACGFEILGLGLIIISFYADIRLLHLVFYHVVFWTFFPLPQMLKKSRGEVVRYLMLNGGLTLGFWLISPASFLPWRVGLEAWVGGIASFAFLHISLSFALSSAHPWWIRRWFFPKT
jgi:hypothetical protein